MIRQYYNLRWSVSLNLVWTSLGKGVFRNDADPSVTERIVRMPGPPEPGREENDDWTMGKATGMADGEVHDRYLAEEAERWPLSMRTL